MDNVILSTTTLSMKIKIASSFGWVGGWMRGKKRRFHSCNNYKLYKSVLQKYHLQINKSFRIKKFSSSKKDYQIVTRIIQKKATRDLVREPKTIVIIPTNWRFAESQS